MRLITTMTSGLGLVGMGFSTCALLAESLVQANAAGLFDKVVVKSVEVRPEELILIDHLHREHRLPSPPREVPTRSAILAARAFYIVDHGLPRPRCRKSCRGFNVVIEPLHGAGSGVVAAGSAVVHDIGVNAAAVPVGDGAQGALTERTAPADDEVGVLVEHDLLGRTVVVTDEVEGLKGGGILLIDVPALRQAPAILSPRPRASRP